MDWYKSMTKQQKYDLKKVVVASVVGTILVMVVPVVIGVIF